MGRGARRRGSGSPGRGRVWGAGPPGGSGGGSGPGDSGDWTGSRPRPGPQGCCSRNAPLPVPSRPSALSPLLPSTPALPLPLPLLPPLSPSPPLPPLTLPTPALAPLAPRCPFPRTGLRPALEPGLWLGCCRWSASRSGPRVWGAVSPWPRRWVRVGGGPAGLREAVLTLSRGAWLWGWGDWWAVCPETSLGTAGLGSRCLLAPRAGRGAGRPVWGGRGAGRPRGKRRHSSALSLAASPLPRWGKHPVFG